MLEGLVRFHDVWFSARWVSIVFIHFQHCIQLLDILRYDNVGACQVERKVIVVSLKTSGSWQILQEVVSRWAEASTAAGSRFNDCNLLALKDIMFIFAQGFVIQKCPD